MLAEELEVALTCIGDRLTRKECHSIINRVKGMNNEINIERLVYLVMGDKIASGKDISRSSSTRSYSSRHRRRSSTGSHQFLTNIRESPTDL